MSPGRWLLLLLVRDWTICMSFEGLSLGKEVGWLTPIMQMVRIWPIVGIP